MILPSPQSLRYLVALADHGHFGRAAEACAVVQRIAAEVETNRVWQRRLTALADQALASVLLAASRPV